MVLDSLVYFGLLCHYFVVALKKRLFYLWTQTQAISCDSIALAFAIVIHVYVVKYMYRMFEINIYLATDYTFK